MAVYERDDPELLDTALKSVFGNDLRPDQVVLVVDGPIGSAIENVVEQHISKDCLEVMRLPVNRGLAAALNAGLTLVRFDWVVRADADDQSLPTRFEAQATAILNDPRISVIGAAIREVERDGTMVAVRRTPEDHDSVLKWLPRRSPINHPAVAYKTELVRRVGGYPAVYRKEDYALWCVFATANARFANLPEVLVIATAGADMYKRRGGWLYMQSEIEMQKLMVRLNLKTWNAALLHGTVRSAVFALPHWLRGKIYLNLLRSRD